MDHVNKNSRTYGTSELPEIRCAKRRGAEGGHVIDLNFNSNNTYENAPQIM